MKTYVFLLFICTFATKVIWRDNEAKMKILGSITATGTMKNFAKDTSKTVKLATEIKNMLNGMCTYSKYQNSYEKIDEKVQNISTDMEVIKEKLDKIQNLVSNIKCNKKVAQLTTEGNHELRIDVEDWDGNKRYAVYGNFSIGDASTKYRLSISNYSGKAGDGMSYFNGMKFTTCDQDNDKHHRNCAGLSNLKGGWWYNNCWTSTGAMLNGHYTQRNSSIQGIRYRTLGNSTQKKSTMKIRKV